MPNIREIQRRLSRWATDHPGERYRDLFNLVCDDAWLLQAYVSIAQNKGAQTPGVDDVTRKEWERDFGANMDELRRHLREGAYSPQPCRRVYVPKASGKLRPLGIPALRDRIVQQAVRMAIEPIFEANFLPCSYGFRPGRSAHMAIDRIRRSITFEGQTTVIDADIRGYFDNIRQDILLRLVQRRISDRRVVKLIGSWLRTGVMEHGELTEPDGLGTPQGGVISPLLANIYLHSFDVMFARAQIRGTLVRYADDVVILTRGHGTQVLEQVRRMLARLGLELHSEKTRVVQAAKGFDFLGVHFRLRPARKRNTRLKQICRRWPSNRSMARIKQKVRETIGRRYGTSLEEVIADLNPMIRGWNAYHQPTVSDRQRLLSLNRFVYERLRIFLKRKYSDQSRGGRRLLGNLPVQLGLCQFG